MFHGTLHLALVHTYLGHFQVLQALCSDFAYSSNDCLHFHGECFQLSGILFYGELGGLTAMTIQKLGKNHHRGIAELSISLSTLTVVFDCTFFLWS